MGMTDKSLCDSCTNIGCEFQSGIVRTKCAFYMPPQLEPDNCGNYVVQDSTTKNDIRDNRVKNELNRVKDELEPTTKNDLGVDCISRKSVITIIQNHWWNCRDIDKLVNELPPVTLQESRWIPVNERLPEEKTAVLLSCDDMYLAKLNPCIGWTNGNNWHTFSAKGSYLVKYPMAWMPLPEPYKAESEKT